jgi:predicted PurR-regulated permease PerM
MDGRRKMGPDVNRLLRLLVKLGITFLSISSLYILCKLAPFLSWLGKVLETLLAPLFLAMVIAYLLNPIVNLLNRRGVPRGMAIVVIYFSFSLFVIVFLLNAIPAFISQSKDLTEYIPHIINTYQLWLEEYHTHKYQLPNGIRIGIEQALNHYHQRTTQSLTNVLDGAGGIFQKLLDLLVIPFMVFYLLKDMEMLHKGFLFFVPSSKRKEAANVLNDMDRALESYIGGQLIICFVVGTFAYIGYWFINMPYALILALAVMITNVIPYIGPLIGAAPSLLVALTISWKMTLLVMIVNLAVQVLEGNIISPMIMGRRLHLHPLIIIGALLVGGEIGGLFGLIFAVPIVAIIRVILQHVILHLVKH